MALSTLLSGLFEEVPRCDCFCHSYPGTVMHAVPCCFLGITTRGRHQDDESHNETREEQTSHGVDLDHDTEDEVDQDAERNDEADELNKEGRRQLRKGNLVEAKKFFWKAYRKCKSGYYRESEFKDNYDQVKKRIENEEAERLYGKGKKYFEAEDFEETFKYFERAYKTCALGYHRESRFDAKMDLATEKITEKNRQADQLNSKGLKAMKQTNFDQALEYFRQAYRMCSNGYTHEAEFKTNKEKAKSEIEIASKKVKADQLNRKGLTAMKKKKLNEALEYFGEAYETCPSNDHERRAEFRANRKKASKELQKLKRAAEKAKEEADLFKKGMKMWEKAWKNEDEEDHVRAEQLFEKALEIFKKCGQSATEMVQLVEVKIDGNSQFNDGIQLQEEGDQFQEVNDLDQAMDRYNMAKEKFDQACTIFAQGAQIRGESRFEDCKNIVEEYVAELANLMQLVQAESLALSLRALTVAERPVSHSHDEVSFDTGITFGRLRVAPNLVVDAN